MPDEDTRSSIYAGGLPYELTEGDIICVFSQYGEISEISLSRDKETGKSRGFCFLKYEDPRSCELAVDNLNGTPIVGRKIKVSYANNTNAVKTIRPTLVAPQITQPPLLGQDVEAPEKNRHHSKRKYHSSSPESERQHHSSRNRDGHRSSPQSRHSSSKHRRDSPDSHSRRPHHKSGHKGRESSPHSRSHHHKSKTRSDRSPSESRSHHHKSKKSHHKSSKRR